MNNNFEKLLNIFPQIKDKKITLVKDGVFSPFVIKGKIVDVKIEPYAQYKESLILIYKENKKKKLKAFRLTRSYQVAIFSEYQDFEDLTFTKEDDFIMSTTYGSFDSKSFTDTLKTREDIKPLILIEG